MTDVANCQIEPPAFFAEPGLSVLLDLLPEARGVGAAGVPEPGAVVAPGH